MVRRSCTPATCASAAAIFEHFGAEVGIAIAVWGNSTEVLIAENHVSLGQGPAISDIATGPSCVRVAVTDNICISPNSEGIDVGFGAVVTGNVIAGKARHGLLLTYLSYVYNGPSNETVIANNRISECGWTGIYVNTQLSNETPSTVGRLLIDSNMIVRCGNATSDDANTRCAQADPHR